MRLLQIIRPVSNFILLLLIIGTVTGCGSTKDALIGPWRMNSSGEIWTFHEDRTITLTGTLFPGAGTYEFVEDDQVAITLEGMPFVRPEFYTVTIDGDELTLTWHAREDFNPNFYFTRVEE